MMLEEYKYKAAAASNKARLLNQPYYSADDKTSIGAYLHVIIASIIVITHQHTSTSIVTFIV